MNRRLCVWIAALGIGCAASFSLGQAPPATNPAEVPELAMSLKASSTITPDQRAEIDGFQKQLVGMMVDGTPAAQKVARDRIVKAAPGKAGVTLSPQYLDAYETQLDQHFVALLKTSPSLRVRLNVGVAAASIAERTETWQLAGTAELLLKDNAEAVALWGMKTAKFVLPYVIDVQVPGKANTLMPLMVSTGLKFSGPTLADAYEGLALKTLNINQPANAKQFKPQIIAVIPYVQKLLTSRVALYGPAIPKDPLLDSAGTTFLVNPAVWPLQSTKQQKDTLQGMHDLLNKSAALYTASNGELLQLVKFVANGVKVAMPKSETNDATASVIAEADNVAKLIISDAPTKVSSTIGGLVTAIEQTPLLLTPAVQGGPATRPSSASSPASNLAVIK